MTGQERRAFLGAQSETVKLKRGNGAGLRLIVPQPFLDHAGVRTAVCCVQQPYGMDVWNQEKYEEYVSGLRVKCH